MAHEEKKDGETLLPHQQYAQLISTFPSCKSWAVPLLIYHDFWYPEHYLPGVIAFRDHFKPRDTDIFLTSAPKSGTTWLISLAFATLNRRDHPLDQNHPLTNTNPHNCVPFLDEFFRSGQASALDNLPSPRLLYCHMAYSLLPKSVTSSDCSVIYICRDPKDTFVSAWYYYNGMAPVGAEPLPFDEAFQMFCNGMSPFGPVWEHYLGYWRESLRRPERILFLKYEEMVEDPVGNLKKLAEFIGCPFSQEEEKQGILEGIVRLCSFEKLSSSEGVTKGVCEAYTKEIVVKNSSFFRRGKVGDWKNHLTPEMAERLDAITEEKLRGSGLSFSRAE